MTDQELKNTLIKSIEVTVTTPYIDTYELLRTLKKSNIYIEYTSIYTRTTWDTYCAVLHVQVPIDDYKEINQKNYMDLLLEEGIKIFGKDDDYRLTDVEIGLLPEKNDIIDFSNILCSEVIDKAIEDAELFMREGKYSSAIDRVHTAFHGYLRKKLDEIGVAYEESNTLSQLYSKFHSNIATARNLSDDMDELIRTSLRSSSGIVSAINDIRNRHSLSHPNDEIIDEKEAKFCISIVKNIVDYIDSI